MTMDLTRSIHPDLMDEYQEQIDLAAGASSPPAAPTRRRRGRGVAAATEASPPGDTAVDESNPDAPTGGSEGVPTASEPTAAPESNGEWLAQLEGKTDAREILAIAREHVSREELAADPFFQGWIGDLANQRARKLVEDQQKQQFERQKAETFARGDLYALGQMEAEQLQTQRQQLQAQAEQQNSPYMIAIRNFQAKLPEPVQQEVQGKNYESYQAYLEAVQDAAIRHGISQEVSKRAAGLQKAELSNTVGSEQSPELDGGPAQAYREITDAQVAAMTLEEYDGYFDEKGRPKPGVRVRLERGIDVQRR
jgi:hypothetical protein